MPPTLRGCGCALFVWLLPWSAMVLPFDGFLGWTIFRQARALTFPTADGVLTRSGVRTVDGSDGPSYRLDIAYDYAVGGRPYAGTRYSYSEMGTNTGAWQRVSNRLPVGTRVPVAYDPADPAESLLRPGPTGFHLAMVWFLTPFNIVMLGGWAVLVHGRRPAFDPAARRGVVTTPGGWRVRLPGVGRAGCFGVLLLGITFVGVFVWAIGWGFDPPVALASGTYLAAVVLAAVVAVRHSPREVEVNDLERVIRLPASDGTTVEVPFAAVREVVVAEEVTHDSEGGTGTAYRCDLIRANAPRVSVATFGEPAAAEALAAWLRERFGLVAPGRT